MKTPSCPRCQSLYSAKISENGRPGKHPMLLRCGHTFCEECLQKCSLRDSCIACPKCQVPTRAGRGTDLYRFVRPDLYTIGIIWSRRMDLELDSQKIYAAGRRKNIQEPKPRVKPENCCSECQINAATCQCVKCDCILCKQCFEKIHQRSSTLKKHIPVSLPVSGIDDRLVMPDKVRLRYCSVHEQCPIEYFCTDDDQAICSRCVIMGDHKGHSVVTIEDKNRDLLSEMDPAILYAQETVWRLEKSEKLLTECIPSARVNTRDVVDQVQQHFLELHSMLQAREEQLIDEVKAAAENGPKCLQDMKSYLQEEKLKLEKVLIEAARAKKLGHHVLVDIDLIIQGLREAQQVACVLTVDKDKLSTPVQFSVESSVKETIQSYGNIYFPAQSQALSLTVPGPDAEKPSADELRTYSVTVSDCDTLSIPDTVSLPDTASVIAEEVTDEMKNTAGHVTARLVKVEPSACIAEKPLTVGSREKVSVTHIKTPAEFYVQLEKHMKQLDILQQKINRHCRSKQGRSDKPEFLENGDYVLAQFSEDKVWYRAQVSQVIETEEKGADSVLYTVFFIDFGNSETLPLQKLRNMKTKFMAQRGFAYECCLFEILPANESEGWTAESVQTMLQMTSTGPLIMTVADNLGEILEVDLGKPEPEAHGGDQRPVSVRDSLVFLEMAIFRASASRRMGYQKKRSYLTVTRIPDNAVIDIGINCTTSPSLFYGQVYSEEDHVFLARLVTSMQETYSDQTRHLYKIFCPRKDMLVAAKYWKDGRWYRAQVTGLPGKRKVEIRYVDYGNTEVVDCSDICKIMDCHIRFPMQALECSLADVEPLENGVWSREAKEWFRRFAELQLCQMRVTDRTDQPNSLVGVLYAVSIETEKLCCINYELVKRGFAKSTGRWSSKENFRGITLSAEMLQDLSSSSSSCSPMSGSYRLGSPSISSESVRCGGRESFDREGSIPRLDWASPLPQKSATGQNSSVNAAQGQQSKQPEAIEEGAVQMLSKLGSDYVEVVMSAFQSPACFYVQLEEKKQELSSLMKDLESCEREPLSDHAWRTGEFCVARYSQDNHWYRAVIVSETTDNKFEVNLVDFGHTDTVPANQMKPLRDRLTKPKSFAEKCHLANLMPAGSTDRTKWSITAKEFLLQQTKGKRLFISLKSEVGESDAGVPVDIMIEEIIPEKALEPSYTKYVSLVALILDKGLAIPCKKPKITGHAAPASPAAKPDLCSKEVLPTVTERATPGDGAAPASPAGKTDVCNTELTTVTEPATSGYRATPASPAGKPSGDRSVPASPAGKPSGDRSVPASPAGKPSGDLSAPASPAGKPSGDLSVPASPAGKPSGDLSAPASPAGKPSGDLSVPASPAGKPSGDLSVPASPVGKPSGDLATPASPAGKPDVCSTELPTVTESVAPNSVLAEDTVEKWEEPETWCPSDFEIAPHPVTPGTLTVLPVHVNDDGVIFAHDSEEGTEQCCLREQLDRFIQNNPACLTRVEVGQLCMAHFDDDNLWYRARILEVYQDSVKVMYVDYGNLGIVSKDMLKIITGDLCALHQLSYVFTLCNLKGGSTGGGFLPASVVQSLRDCITNITCTVDLKCSSNELPMEVDMLLPSGQSVGTHVMEMERQREQDIMEEMHMNSNRISSVLKSCCHYQAPDLGEKGESVHGLITYIELPNLVYFQRHGGTSDKITKEMSDFTEMMEELNNYFGNLPPDSLELEDLPAAGQMCCAQYSEDSRWYRGLVIGSDHSNMTVHVLYVDFGNSEVVMSDRLKTLPDEFQNLPAQAVRANLHVELPDSSKVWSAATYKAMMQAIHFQSHIVTIREKDPLTVELFSPTSTSPLLSYQQLIDDGLVMLPSPSSSSDKDEGDDDYKSLDTDSGSDNVEDGSSSSPRSPATGEKPSHFH